MGLYEYHGLGESLPIILHLDTLKKDGYSKSVANWHENIELLFCIKGHGHTIINSNAVATKAGAITVINSGMMHSTIAESDILEYYCLIIDTGFLKNLGLDVENTSLEECIKDDTLNEYFMAIISEYYNKKDFFEATIKGHVISLVSHLFRHYSLGKKPKVSDDIIKESIRYIGEHFKEDILVSDIAEHVGFSRFYFSRKFAGAVGCSVKEYIQKIRCREAESLLRTKRYTVSEVSTECGFSDVSYFTKTFKKVLGYLPSKVR